MERIIENSREWWKQNLMKALTRKIFFSSFPVNYCKKKVPFLVNIFFSSHFCADYRRFSFPISSSTNFLFLPVANKRAPRQQQQQKKYLLCIFFSFFDTIFHSLKIVRKTFFLFIVCNLFVKHLSYKMWHMMLYAENLLSNL